MKFFVEFYFVVVSVVTVIPFPVHMFHECVFIVGCCEDGWCGGYLCCWYMCRLLRKSWIPCWMCCVIMGRMVLCVVVECVVGIWQLGGNGIGVEWTVLGLYHLLGVGSSARGEW